MLASVTASAGPVPLIQTLIDSDVALEWAALLAARWLDANPLEPLVPTSPPDLVRSVVLDVIDGVAAAFAASAERGGAELCRDRDVLRRWLALRVDDISQPDSRADPARLSVSLAPSRPVSTAPIRRWNSACREHVLAAGVGWLRGRHLAETRFVVARIGTLWTVVEHGAFDADPAAVHALLVPAAADAVVRQSLALGHQPGLYEEVAAQFFADAQSHVTTVGNLVPMFAQRVS